MKNFNLLFWATPQSSCYKVLKYECHFSLYPNIITLHPPTTNTWKMSMYTAV